MNEPTAEQCVKLVESILGQGKVGGSIVTHDVNGRKVKVEPIESSTENGQVLTWDDGKHEYRLRMTKNVSIGTISQWK